MNVTTLVPAFKPKYLPQLIHALRFQTRSPQSVIISDDSPNQAFINSLKQLQGSVLQQELNLRVIQGPQQGGLANMRHLLNAWGGETELLHFLFDDDLIYPEFYRWHIDAQRAGYQCTVSRRWMGAENGQPLGSLDEPESVRDSKKHLLGFAASDLFPATVGVCRNWLGEMSNTVFHRDMADLVQEMALDGIPYNGLEDIGCHLRASTRMPIGFITQHQGMFRRSPEQNTSNPQRRIIKLGHLAWIALAYSGVRMGYLQQEQCRRCIHLIGRAILATYGDAPDMRAFCELIPKMCMDEPGVEGQFLALWSDFVGEPVVEEAERMAGT